MVIVASCCLFLTSHREVAYALHITDDTCQIINILALAVRTFLKIMFADMSAAVADCIRNVECEIITTFLSSNTQKLGVLSLAEVLLEIEVKS